MKREFAVIDLFAGPGGLAEGFSSVKGERGAQPFKVVLSVEKDASAFETLRLRSFLRQFKGKKPKQYYRALNEMLPQPDWATLHPDEWRSACEETLQLELGSREGVVIMNERIARIRKKHGDRVVLIGGPPCQAYSLVGRARNKGVKNYIARMDDRHFLYKEYIRILQELMPVAFIMENVKGFLSSAVDGERVFDRVLNDLSAVGGGAYRFVPLTPRTNLAFGRPTTQPHASDFVVRAEDHGVPQARHRVIIVGVRIDVLRAGASIGAGILPRWERHVTVADVLKGMPKLRSGLNEIDDSADAWRDQLSRIARRQGRIGARLPALQDPKFRALAIELAENLARSPRKLSRTGGSYASTPTSCPEKLSHWIVDDKLTRFPNNETRTHMLSDLERYLFASLYGSVAGTSPKASIFPPRLAPQHRNWLSGKFADRFRVQLWHLPASTVTSHISKDGHYFIHPDPSQCRSLTVREAARLQTFPDNYLFLGNRTQQFIQVGNAVPPFLAHEIARAVWELISQSVERQRGG